MSDYPFINPIIVTKNLGIVDGQHRYKACEKLGAEVAYIELDFTSDQVHEDAFITQLQALVEEQRLALEKFFQEQKTSYLAQIELSSSAHRMEKFFQFQTRFTTSNEFSRMLAYCYTSSNNNYMHRQALKKAFSSKRIEREYLMSESDRRYLDNLPDEIVIFRGMSINEVNSNSFGISWTLDKAVAEKFASTYIHNYHSRGIKHLVKELSIKKDQVLAYFSEREEEEIIYLG